MKKISFIPFCKEGLFQIWRGSYQTKRSPRLKRQKKIFLDYFLWFFLKNNRTLILPGPLTVKIWHLFQFFQVRFVSSFSIVLSDSREEVTLQNFTPSKGAQRWHVRVVNLSFITFIHCSSFIFWFQQSDQTLSVPFWLFHFKGELISLNSFSIFFWSNFILRFQITVTAI